jgi:hypothetical protein
VPVTTLHPSMASSGIFSGSERGSSSPSSSVYRQDYTGPPPERRLPNPKGSPEPAFLPPSYKFEANSVSREDYPGHIPELRKLSPSKQHTIVATPFEANTVSRTDFVAHEVTRRIIPPKVASSLPVDDTRFEANSVSRVDFPGHIPELRKLSPSKQHTIIATPFDGNCECPSNYLRRNFLLFIFSFAHHT